MRFATSDQPADFSSQTVHVTTYAYHARSKMATVGFRRSGDSHWNVLLVPDEAAESRCGRLQLGDSASQRSARWQESVSEGNAALSVASCAVWFAVHESAGGG